MICIWRHDDVGPNRAYSAHTLILSYLDWYSSIRKVTVKTISHSPIGHLYGPSYDRAALISPHYPPAPHILLITAGRRIKDSMGIAINRAAPLRSFQRSKTNRYASYCQFHSYITIQRQWFPSFMIGSPFIETVLARFKQQGPTLLRVPRRSTQLSP
jgi:hypothetical protein